MSDINTANGGKVTSNLIGNYFRALVNKIFKILPMKENEEDSLCIYLESLQAELLGCKELVGEIKENPLFLSLLSILQYLIDNPDLKTLKVRREVFHAISICNQIKSIYATSEVV